MMMTRPVRQRGLTLIELVLALVAAAIVVGALDGLVGLALQTQSSGQGRNELVYNGRFALERMVRQARASTPKVLTTPTLAGSTGNWFAPVMYCLKGGNRLVESDYSETSCTGAKVIAEHVIAFSALPAQSSANDRPIAQLTLTLQAGGAPITLSTSVRLGSDL
jgi:prepilin-type N-terminal cleavage/methylation domain-containing protein